VLLLDGVDGGDDVPVNIGSARWSRQRSPVHIPVVQVNQLHHVGNRDEVNRGVSVIVSHFHGVEECVNESLLSPGELSSVVLDREKDTGHGGKEVVLGSFSGRVLGLQLEVESLPVDCVLGTSVESERLGSPVCLSLEDILGHLGSEADQGIWISLKVGGDSVPVPNWSEVEAIVVVSLGVIVLPPNQFTFVLLLSSTLVSVDQVDWRLVLASAVVVWDAK